jgi:ankyrin repeat protein
MGLLLLLYIVSNSFPAESQSEKIYQLLKTQGNFSPDVFRVLEGPSSDSVLENLFKLAVEAEDLPMVTNLIKAGANVNANNCKLRNLPIPWTPLQFACLKGNTKLVQELITAGSDIDERQSGWKFSTILLAIQVQLVQVLLDEGADVNAVDTDTNYTKKSIRD